MTAHYQVVRLATRLRIYWRQRVQNVNRVCSSKRLLLAASEKIVPPRAGVPVGWIALPNSGDVMFPMIGPGLLWLSRLRIDIEITMLYLRLVLAGPPAAVPPPKTPPLSARRRRRQGFWMVLPGWIQNRRKCFAEAQVHQPPVRVLSRSCGRAALRRAADSDRATRIFDRSANDPLRA
jgi:hypothetical protein